MSVTATAGVEEAKGAADWVAAFAEGWRAPAGAAAFVAHFRPMLAPDVRLIQPQVPPLVGHESFARDFAAPLFELIPDAHAEVERWAARGEHLYIELTVGGHIAGRPVSWRVCDRVMLAGGVAIERESYFDSGTLLAAVARTPRAWPLFARARIRRLMQRISRRRTR